MSVVRTLRQLAEQPECHTEDGLLRLTDCELDMSLSLDGQHQDHVVFQRVSFTGGVSFRDCTFEELVIDHCSAESLLIADCRIQRVVIRSFPIRADLVIAGGIYTSIELHACGQTTLERLRIIHLLNVYGIRRSVIISRVAAAAVHIDEQISVGRDAKPTITVTTLRVEEDLDVGNLWLARLKLEDVAAQNIRLRRLRLDLELSAENCKTRADFEIVDLCVRPGYTKIIRGVLLGDLNINGLESTQFTIEKTRLTDLAVTGGSSVDLVNTVVTGTLRFPEGSPSIHAEGDATQIATVDLGTSTFNRPKEISQFLEQHFTSVNVVALDALRQTLNTQQRHREEDQLYYLRRQLAALREPLPRRLLQIVVFGYIFGWGVRLIPPLRTLAIGIIITALVIVLTGVFRAPHESAWSLLALGRSTALAAALWLNVGTGIPQTLPSATWTYIADIFTALGLVLITLSIGIAIRKLVR
jgi:hypothetical protein